MSELTNTKSGKFCVRWQLLMTASTLALIATVDIPSANAADQDADRPSVWIDLGGQLERTSGQGDGFPVGFLMNYPDSLVLQGTSPLKAQNPAPLSFAENGKITLQPNGSDWVFSAGVSYGRSSNNKHVDHQTKGVHYAKYKSGVPNPTQVQIFTQEKFADTKVQREAIHAILDFSVGKDVGIGIFGRETSSAFNLGVRFAQFSSRESFDARARPDLQFEYIPSAVAPTRALLPYYHTYHATGQAWRSFHGIGPSLSWNGSTPVVGNPQSGEVTFDWGANAAVLFGKQKAHVRHQESAHYVSPGAFLGGVCAPSSPCYAVVYQNGPHGHDTDRSVVVPNFGGLAGISVRRGDAKINVGYRADFFFGAMDVGVDARKSATVGFYGPFASVSIGLGG